MWLCRNERIAFDRFSVYFKIFPIDCVVGNGLNRVIVRLFVDMRQLFQCLYENIIVHLAGRGAPLK